MLTHDQVQALEAPFPPEALSADTSEGRAGFYQVIRRSGGAPPPTCRACQSTAHGV
jgi:hypothetical protein